MADFNIAYKITSVNEGGYAHVVGDLGGETYKGIARNYHPKWDGWATIDSIKKANPFLTRKELDARLAAIPELQTSVKNFFKVNFWDINWLDKFNSQDIANELYDTGVNFGPGRALKMLQEAVNFTRTDVTLDVDGAIGNNTLNATNSHADTKLLFKGMNLLQGEAYIEAWRKNSIQEKFIKGWFTRIAFL